MHEKREKSDVDLRAILAGAGVVIAGILVALAAPAFILVHNAAPANAPNNARLPALAAPRQPTAPGEDIAAFRQEKAQRLESQGYDAETGTWHVPIERAMALLEKEAKRTP